MSDDVRSTSTPATDTDRDGYAKPLKEPGSDALLLLGLIRRLAGR